MTILAAVSDAKTARYAGLLIWTAYFVVPTDAGGFVHGLPLGPVDTCALLMLGWLAAFGGRVRGAVAAVVLIASAAIAAAIPGTGGLRARYFANAEGVGGHERSTEYPDSAFTRVDRRLEFAPGGPELPVYFFNDSSRFNFYRAGEPHRRRLPFSVTWSGLWLTAAGSHHLYLSAPQAAGEVFIDGASMLTAAAGNGLASGEITLADGWHRLDVRFSSPYGTPRAFAAGFIANGRYQPFDAATVVTQQVREWQMQTAAILRIAKTVADAVAIAWLGWLFALSVRERVAGLWQQGAGINLRRRALPLLVIVAAVEALVFAWPWSQQVMLLAGGDDPLTYEGYARDILLNGILMNGGLPAGQGDPFYYQAFYPYFLATLHALFGEGTFGIMLVQRLLSALAIWKLADMAVDFSSEAAWSIALAIAGFFVYWKFWPISNGLANEALYVPLLVVWAAALAAAARRPAPGRALVSGLLAGVTAMTRSTLLLSWAAVWPLCWLAWKGASRRGVLLAVLVLSSAGAFSLIAIRNGIVAHVFAPTPTGLGINLLGGNELPEGLTLDLTTRAPLYERFNLEETTVQVIEYAIAAPGAFAANLGRKALFALGFYEPYAPGWGSSPVYIAVWTSGLVGLVLALTLNPGSRIAVLLPAVIALSQFLAVVIVYPRSERLIIPIHILLVPYSAVAAWWVGGRLFGRNRPGRGPVSRVEAGVMMGRQT